MPPYDVPVLCAATHNWHAAAGAEGAAKYIPFKVLLNRVAGHLYVGEANRRYLAHYVFLRIGCFFVLIR